MLSFSVSVLEAARFLPAGAARDRLRNDRQGVLDSILRLPHRPGDGQFLVNFPVDRKPEEAAGTYSKPFRYGYGGGFTADNAVLLLAVHRLTGDPRAFGRPRPLPPTTRTHDPPPPTEIVRAHVYAASSACSTISMI